MSRRSRFSTPGLLRRHFATRASGTLLIGALLAATVFAVAIVPRAVAGLSDDELRYAIAAESPALTDFVATGPLGVQRLSGATAAEAFSATNDALAGIPDSVQSPLKDVMGDVTWIARFQPQLVSAEVERPGIQPAVRLTIDLDWADRVQFTEGAAPAVADSSTIEIAVSERAARVLELAVGDALEYPDARLIVSGIFAPVDPDDPYWLQAPEVLEPTVTRRPGSPDTVTTSAYMDPLSARSLQSEVPRAELRAWYPAVASTLAYAEADELLAQIEKLATLGRQLPGGDRVDIRTGLIEVVERTIEQVTVFISLLALLASAPLGVLFAVLVLGIRTAVARRQATITLALARGASEPDARTVMALEGAVIAVPALIAGGILAVVVGSPMRPEWFVAPALIALAVPVVFALSIRTSAGRLERTDLGARSRSRVRWVAEVAIVALAAVASFLLGRRGIEASAAAVGVDPLIVASPLLLSVAVCVVVLRLYPLPLLAIQRRQRRRRGAVGLLGSVRAVREPAIGSVSAAAMLIAVSTAACSLVLGATVNAGLEASARAEVGADVRIDSREIDVDAVRATPGVLAAAPLEFVPSTGLTFGSNLSVTLVVADTAALHDVRPDLPALENGEIVISSDLADRVSGQGTAAGIAATVVGTVPPDALPGLTGPWALMDSADYPAFEPTVVLASTVAGAPDLAAPAAATVTDVNSVLAANSARPTVVGLTTALTIAAIVSALMAALTVVLAAVASAPARNRLMSVVRILGMSPRQLRAVMAWEIVPLAATAIVAGIGLGIGLPFVIAALVDLRAFVGGSATVAIEIPWLFIGAGAGGFAVVVAIAGAISIAIANRADPARQIRMGS